ncbi:MAG: hypothetical protein ACRC0J_16190 [Shewanella oncorhynchi]
MKKVIAALVIVSSFSVQAVEPNKVKEWVGVADSVLSLGKKAVQKEDPSDQMERIRQEKAERDAKQPEEKKHVTLWGD